LIRCGGNRKVAQMKKKALLLSYHFQSHLNDSTKQKFRDGNTELAVIPGGQTLQLQLLYASLNKPFKVFVREEWNK
jgi:hypothetical protein